MRSIDIDQISELAKKHPHMRLKDFMARLKRIETTETLRQQEPPAQTVSRLNSMAAAIMKKVGL